MHDQDLKGHFQSVKEVVEDLERIIESVEKDFFQHRVARLPQAEALDKKVREKITGSLLSLNGREKEALELAEIYKGLEVIRDSLKRVANAVQAKIAEKTLFSNKAAEEMRSLFSELHLLFRNLSDFLLTNNEILFNWLKEKQESFEGACRRYATEHEERLVKGICMPRSSTLYLAILENFCNVSWHLFNLAQSCKNVFPDRESFK